MEPWPEVPQTLHLVLLKPRIDLDFRPYWCLLLELDDLLQTDLRGLFAPVGLSEAFADR